MGKVIGTEVTILLTVTLAELDPFSLVFESYLTAVSGCYLICSYELKDNEWAHKKGEFIIMEQQLEGMEKAQAKAEVNVLYFLLVWGVCLFIVF